MFTELLDASVVKGLAGDVLREARLSRLSSRGGAADVSPADLKHAKQMLEAGLEDMKPQEGIFISRDPAVSNLQSAADAAARKRDVDPSAKLSSRAPKTRAFDKFSTNDIPRWVLYCGVAKGLALFRDKHAFVKPPSKPCAIGDTARLVLFGDWGSGLPGAIKVGEVAREQLEDAAKRGVDAHAVHLGDVYYSGWASEYQERALGAWPVWPKEDKKYGSWCVNANHDMFSGGYGYFDTLLADRRFHRQKGSSEFVLQNNHWNFVGIDTAYEENTIQPGRGAWALKQLASGNRGRVLLSHHYYFSAFEKFPLKVPSTFRTALKKNPIDAWFWGHEHRAAIYHARDGVRHPHCVGHGGIPERPSTDSKPRAGCKKEINSIKGGKNGPWKKFGLVVIDCEPKRLKVTYLNEDGKAEHRDEVVRI